MKIGLYGGTFSPPHLGHVRAARCFIQGVGLDKLIVMPAGIPPHKIVDFPIPPEHRLKLVQLAFDGIGEVSEYEMNKDGASYTYLTLRWLKEQYPFDEIYLCMGEDMFLSFEKWREFKEIFDGCSIVCLRRENTGGDEIFAKNELYKKSYGANTLILSYEPLVVSSTEIRELAEKKESIEHLVPKTVADYISINGLYNRG
ncbi:MAG: nicotinate (nicotinamide) nucleotide adenylyltransferase [Clostridia bacterium]|nr:nicotinate (nicotinamide) nucleotide adenylyltransferase [Clostridia bacterium]